MLYWLEYEGHKVEKIGKRKPIDNTIFTFDIETTSYITLENRQYETKEYLKFSEDEKENCSFMSTMYIWMFGVNNIVYYGRTWNEFELFLERLDFFNPKYKKYVFVHNLSYEFQFLRNIVKFKNVFSRKSRKVIKFELEKYNIEFRCTYYMTNVKLEKLPKIYKLNTKKLVGNLDYTKIRHSKTKLTSEELSYCENDCLVIYEYIKLQLEKYKSLKNLPLTSTGFVRKELKNKLSKNFSYKKRTQKAINTDGKIFNLLEKCFMGGYTHANWTKSNEIIKNVTSYDFTSSYPYVMLTEKFPSSEFKKCNIKNISQIIDKFCYIIHIKFYNIQCKFFNNFISNSKCLAIKNGKYDNGRLISADEIEIVLTDIDLKFIFESYNFEKYEFIEVYWSFKNYLPKEYIEFILEKYKNKTEFKGVEGKEIEYALEKAKFNSIYGMTVTNNIRDNVIFDNIEWKEEPLTNEEIINLLEKQKQAGFLSYSWGVWVTAYARYNLLSNLIKLDNYVVYSDTDSLKLQEGFNIEIINKYNENVKEKIKKVCNDLKLSIDDFMPKDKFGKIHCLGLFDFDGFYKEFKTLGAKKYAYINEKDELHITVSGVPKSGAKALKNLDEFKNDFVFEFKDTNKYTIAYNDNQEKFTLTDYQNEKLEIKDKYGCCLIPTTYKLGIAEEYFELITNESSRHSIYKE